MVKLTYLRGTCAKGKYMTSLLNNFVNRKQRNSFENHFKV